MTPALQRLFQGTLFVLAAIVVPAASSHAPVPEPKIVRGENCVEPVDVMRRDHMGMLMHQRDDTVIRGIRTPKHSLVGCVECHADTNAGGEYIPVDDPGQFCSTCHEYAAVELDCFECHASVPFVEEHASKDIGSMLEAFAAAGEGERPHVVLPRGVHVD